MKKGNHIIYETEQAGKIVHRKGIIVENHRDFYVVAIGSKYKEVLRKNTEHRAFVYHIGGKAAPKKKPKKQRNGGITNDACK